MPVVVQTCLCNALKLSWLSPLWCVTEENTREKHVLLTVFTFLICLTLSDVFSVAFSFVLKDLPLPFPYSPLLTILHHFRSGCQSALLIYKDPRAWNADSEHRPNFQSLILPSRFPLEEDCFVFSLSHFLVTWQKGMEQAMEVLEMAKQIN